METSKRLNNCDGFSLVELMIVVSLLAVMLTIAVPAYRGFQNRARQKEGFKLLNTYYMAAENTRAEFGRYPGNFVQTGFAPEGQLLYRITAEDNPDIAVLANDDRCVDTAQACNCDPSGTLCPGFKTWTEAPAGIVGANPGPTAPALGACPGFNNSGTQMDVRMSAVLDAAADSADVYRLQTNKILTMCIDGQN